MSYFMRLSSLLPFLHPLQYSPQILHLSPPQWLFYNIQATPAIFPLQSDTTFHPTPFVLEDNATCAVLEDTTYHFPVGVEGKNAYSLGMLKSLVSGAKRGFSDAIDGGSGKWILSGKSGSEVCIGKDGGLFSPRGVGVGVGAGKAVAVPGCTNQQASVVKEKIPQS